MTTRAVLIGCSLLLTGTGCSSAATRTVAEAPAPEPTPADAEMPRPEDEESITVCVLLGSRLGRVLVEYDPANNDTLYNGRRFRDAFPPSLPYAAEQPWYVNSEPLLINGHRLIKFGLPRVLGEGEVSAVGEYRGVPVFAERGSGDDRRIVYLPLRPGCEFQPYQDEAHYRAVRG